MYRFDLPSTALDGALGACHAVEVPFVFDNLDRGGVEMLLGGLDDGARPQPRPTRRAAPAVARTGRPSLPSLDWPAYDLERRRTCLLDRTPTVVADPDGAVRALWAEIDAERAAPSS